MNKPRLRKAIDPETGLVVERIDRTYQYADNVFPVKVDGKTRHIIFDEHNAHAMFIARSMKNLGVQEINLGLKALYKLNHYLALINTGLSPEFVITNFARDIQSALVNLNDTQAHNVKFRVFKGLPGSIMGIRQHQKGKGNGEWKRWYDEFYSEGAKTGWIDHYNNIENRRKSLENMIRRQDSFTLNSVMTIYEWVQDWNTAIENAVRLSTYRQLREQGFSQHQSANAAKNLTVNFNRKGDAGQMLNAFYLFFQCVHAGLGADYSGTGQ